MRKPGRRSQEIRQWNKCEINSFILVAICDRSLYVFVSISKGEQRIINLLTMTVFWHCHWMENSEWKFPSFLSQFTSEMSRKKTASKLHTSLFSCNLIFFTTAKHFGYQIIKATTTKNVTDNKRLLLSEARGKIVLLKALNEPNLFHARMHISFGWQCSCFFLLVSCLNPINWTGFMAL